MAREGTHLAQAFTCQPVCAPARASLQTGMYASNAGVWRNGIPLPADCMTLARCFNDAGYHSGYIGKWHLGRGDERGPVAESRRGGYQYWLGSQRPGVHVGSVRHSHV